ncbi:hypothetical protein [Sphingomonas sp. CROZ-RG-20F-R02-07]|uniref:hypothetical protein n=1 Tax=Sphingomonas sp. CROZ-RG-20F-R02-07 TaxID=2914832 RepID=UPI001F5670FF|nr:hypothetical protein [Sphingomonas sp. CROZ-RG-20F-R02-07]
MLYALMAMVAQLPVPTAPGAPPLPPLHGGRAEMTCPVGGARFEAVTTPVYSTMGRRPDEKPYSDVPFPRPIAECPDNGLVIFADYSPDEIRQLATWIATPTYQTMRSTESPFYRAYWLAVKVGRPMADALELLLPAIWQAKQLDGDDRRRPKTTRYQNVFIDGVEKMPAEVPPDDRLWLQEQAANALREMGKWAAADKMLALAGTLVPQTTRPALAIYFKRLNVVIARHDPSDEPLDMIPDVQAALICKRKKPATPFEVAYCAKPEIAKIYQ